MSTYILMKILELMPRSYDWGIHLITRGKIEKAYDRLCGYIKKGDRVLDIGCGTGALSFRAAEKEARVKGFDVNVRMLETARLKADKAGLSQSVEFLEMGVAELGNEKEENYDVVTSGLCFSELSEDEIQFTLNEIERILKPGGLLLVADEVQSRNVIRKFTNNVIRFFLSIVVFLLTGSKTKALNHFPERVRDSGLNIVSQRLNKRGNFLELAARKPVNKA